MKENVVVSDKGQIVLTPAVVLETEIYTDEQVATWDRSDAFRKGERQRLASRLTGRRR